MGKKSAPAYANIFMADWEREALQITEKKPTQIFRRHLGGLDPFPAGILEICGSIQVTAEINEKQITFLDTVTFKGQEFDKTRVLDTKVFFKPTDTHALLHRKSYHPKHTLRIN